MVLLSISAALGFCLSAKAETISGVYSFTASNFNNGGFSLATSPLQQIGGSFSFTYSTDNSIPNPNPEPGLPVWGSLLFMPTSVDLTFGSTTFTTSDVRLSLSLYHGYLDLRLESLDASTTEQTSPDYFLLDFALNPGGQVLRSLSNSPLFIYSLDNLQNPDPSFFFTNDVTLSCLPHECAGYRPLSAVPEPSTWAMMLIGFAGLGFAFRQLTTEGVVRLTNEPPREKQS